MSGIRTRNKYGQIIYGTGGEAREKVFSVATNPWEWEHGFGDYPVIEATDENRKRVGVAPEHVDENNVKVTLKAAQRGILRAWLP